MERPLKEHIAFLEKRQQELRDLDRGILGDTERALLDSDIQSAELALSYYRKALDLERQLV